MLKKLFLLALFASTLFAEPSVSEAKSAIEANPDLLNTTQAQLYMQKNGLTKEEILNKINKKSENTDTQIIKDIENNIDFEDDVKKDGQINIDINGTDNNSTDINITEDNITKLTTYINPLEYKMNTQILEEITDYQTIKETKELKRFSDEFFRNKNKYNINNISIPNSYKINKTDAIEIWIYGSKNKNFTLDVNDNGNINIPNIGPIKVANKDVKTVKEYITNKLKKIYSNSSINVSIKSNSSIQVNLVGDVKAPGLYNVNTMSSVKNLLILANGVKDSGSLRSIVIKREGKILANIDFYKLLLNADESTNIILQNNDKVFIPKVKKLVSLYGEVNNKAIYELKNNETLYHLLKFSSGIKSSASKVGFIVKRYENNNNLKTIEVNLKNSRRFKLKDGDKVYVYKIDKIHNKSVYLYGNVVRPGEKELPNSKSLKKLLQSQIAKLSMKGVFLQNTLFSYAMIKRQTKNLTTKVESFNLKDLLEGKIDITLKNNDKIFIFNKYNSNVNPYVKIEGLPVINKGKYNYYENMKVRDILNQAGVLYPTKKYSIKVLTYNTDNFMPKSKIVDDSYTLSAFDEIKIYSYYSTNKIKYINMYGEINSVGKYVLNKNMTITDAVKLAGGFNEKSYTSYIELVRYKIENEQRKKDIIKVLNVDFDTFILSNYDEVTVHAIPNWTDRKVITLKGEVKFPGNYVIESGDRLSDVIRRAGGYTKSAFLDGALFSRDSIKKLQQTKMRQAILELKQKSISLTTAPAGLGEGSGKVDTASLVNMIDNLSKEAEKLAPIGRISINLQEDLNKFENSTSNLVLKDKDSLTIPSFNDTILVIGEIMNSTSIIFKSKNVDDYIASTGGLNQRADEDNIFIVHANGSATKVDYGWFSNDDTKIIRRGDTVVIPRELVTYSGMQIAKDISSILYQFALTAASLTVVGAF